MPVAGKNHHSLSNHCKCALYFHKRREKNQRVENPSDARPPLKWHPLAAGLQVVGLVGLWWASDKIVHAAKLPIPGSVLGLGILLILLGTGILPLAWVKAGSQLLLAEMLLFFVPATVTVVKYPAVVLHTGWQLLVILLLGTTAVMVGTALVVETAVRAQARWRR